MSLGRYPSEVRAIADELGDILNNELSQQAAKRLSARGAAAYNAPSQSELDAAIKFLGQSPSQRARKLKSMSPEDACTLVLHARFVGLKAAQALHFADRFEMVPGKGYRDAAVFAAREISNARFSPEPHEVASLPMRYDDEYQPALGSREGSRWTFDDE
ncbi:hypothetical protein [Leisingera caerulea]|uniref:Uncharacterized protein n=1 Tax=Leisingera caerulea TaxID=506591 RepID=A0A9Q9HNB1_LEICA|nr:hypothetical protein [Leisingera caerulea]UWQ55921.1 hypothetical protein K3721_18980 [Leisingera caerulea]